MMDILSDVGMRVCGHTIGNNSGDIARGRKADTKIYMSTFYKPHFTISCGGKPAETMCMV